MSRKTNLPRNRESADNSDIKINGSATGPNSPTYSSIGSPSVDTNDAITLDLSNSRGNGKNLTKSEVTKFLNRNDHGTNADKRGGSGSKRV